MSESPAWAIYRGATVRTAKRLVAPLLLALAVSWVCVGSTVPLPTVDMTTTASGASWLHLPALLLTGFALLIAVDDWPLLARDREDAVWIRRFLHGPFRGCLVFSAGTLTALALALTLLGSGFALLLSAHRSPEPRAFDPFVSADGAEFAELTPQQDRIVLVRSSSETASAPVDTIIVRAFPVRPPGGNLLTPLRLEVWADGERLGASGAKIVSWADRFEVHFPPRATPRIELRRTPIHPGRTDPNNSSNPTTGDDTAVTSPLGALFPPRAVEAVLAEPHSRTANLVLATLTYLLAAAGSFTFAILLRDRLSTGIATMLLLGTLIGITLFEATPQILAVRACAEGRWLGTEPLSTRIWIPLAVVAAVLLAVAVLTSLRRSPRIGR